MKRPITFLVCVVLLFAISGFAQPAAQNAQPTDAYKATLDRLESLTTLPLADWRFHADLPHPESSSLDDSTWEVMKVGDKWTSGPRVLRRLLEIPEKIEGYAIQGARVKLDLNISSRDAEILTVFSNGSVAERTDEDMQQPIVLTENAQPGQKFVIAIRVDANRVESELRRAQLLIEPPSSRPDPRLVREGILSALPVIDAYEENKSQRDQQLDEALKAINLAALDQGDQLAFDTSLREAQTKLQVLNPWLKQFTIHAVGNSHIDMAWLWPWTETVEVVRNTFRSALDLMREYPDFKFTMSSARTYEWMEEKYPDLFKEIQDRVKEGRWEVIGGMWVEPDLNMPAGESLTRQILIGKRYFRKKFGVDIKIGWNPDSFGYNWQLPQIYKKSGMDYFVTQKLLWAHEFTTFPYKLFWWEAPDGSRLLTYFPHDYAGGIEAEGMAKDLSVWAPAMYGPQLTDTPEMMHLYGVGDHGGGPTRTMLDNAARLMSPEGVYPKLELGTAKAFFDDLEKKLPSMKVPSWKDELYFQYHRGVLTTQAETKRRIRRSEETMLNAEKFASIALLYGVPYQQEEMERAWKRLLFDHFHDIMPGSGIAVNYLDAQRNLEDVQRAGHEIIDGAFHEIVAHINTLGDGVPVVVFNSLSWPRTEMIEAEAQLPNPVREIEVVDSAGKMAESQVLNVDPRTHQVRFLLLASMPPLGYKTYFVRPAKTLFPKHAAVKATAESLENDFIRLKIDPRTGCLTSLFDKRSQTEALAPAETDTGGPKNSMCGNLLQTFVDKPKQWDAWNIDADFEKQHWDLDKADEVRLTESGPLRAVIRVKKHFQNSAFVQDITMYTGVPRVDVKMQADWHEKHILLKVAFPLSAHNEKATFEIPYGSIERPTTRRTPAEQAEFEVPALRWADVSNATHGFSLLNDCKYGYDAKGNVLRLSLLRSPVWPDPHADEGHHEFTYSLYPHGGTWREALTIRRGYELNYTPFALQTDKHQGTLPAEHSFVQVEAENVVLTAIKKAEDDDALILRFYEWAGRESNVRLQLPPGAQSASETDLMEKPTAKLPVQNGVVSVHTKPFEIKTVKVVFGSQIAGQTARSR
ncbi:MAG TPA: glycoside hydrolase family 38 C-terminal domain-containing protein [Terriglobales bacterium]|nr:glycoside hydrolase family 38 C-terminal domain-containing protein [Terriglobales bacterium]